MKPTTSIFDINHIELHYWFSDNSHTMNAVVYNKCEYEFLGIIKEIATKLEIDVEIETEPLQNGGIRSWLRFKSKDGASNDVFVIKKQAIKIAILTYLVTNVAFTPLTTTLDTITKHVIELLFEDKEIKELEKELEKAKLKNEIAQLKRKTEILCKDIDENIIKKKKSNYYDTINQYDKVQDVSFSIANKNKQIIEEHKIQKLSFREYILVSDDLEPEENETATIEIISPVLKKGKYKWVGIYNGEVIQFTLKSNEFKTLVQTGRIEFKNGSSIICHLTTKKRITNEGEVKVSGYEVTLVDKYFENDTPIETPEGRRNRQQKESERNQMKLFDDF